MSKREFCPIGVRREGGWSFEVVWICFDTRLITIEKSYISLLIDSIENGADDDYVYSKRGVLIWHRGRRGIMISMWHVGVWGDAVEIFFNAIYVGDSDHRVEYLCARDPIFSEFDFDAIRYVLNKLEMLV